MSMGTTTVNGTTFYNYSGNECDNCASSCSGVIPKTITISYSTAVTATLPLSCRDYSCTAGTWSSPSDTGHWCILSPGTPPPLSPTAVRRMGYDDEIGARGIPAFGDNATFTLDAVAQQRGYTFQTINAYPFQKGPRIAPNAKVFVIFDRLNNPVCAFGYERSDNPGQFGPGTTRPDPAQRPFIHTTTVRANKADGTPVDIDCRIYTKRP
ncbi:MAG: hypothetical protein JSS02_10350 [Planctomycetes bacterium]|nr:hypothetical protein [Planctomycetota bacterium]